MTSMQTTGSPRALCGKWWFVLGIGKSRHFATQEVSRITEATSNWKWEHRSAEFFLHMAEKLRCPVFPWGKTSNSGHQTCKSQSQIAWKAVLHHRLEVHNDLRAAPLRACTACNCGRFIMAKI